MSLLADIVTRWANVSALHSVVPSTKVIVGEPILGWDIPSVALTGYVREKSVRVANADRIERLTLEASLRGATATALESLLLAMAVQLPPVPLTGGGSIRSYEMFSARLARDPTSKQYVIQATIVYMLW